MNDPAPSGANLAIKASADVTVAPPVPRDFCIVGADGKPIVTIHPDGHFELNRPELADEGARIFAEFVTRYLRGGRR